MHLPDNSTVTVSLRNGASREFWANTYPPTPQRPHVWHDDVFRAFGVYLDSGAFDAYVGFGEWIGPTVLFAARRRVRRAFALEPDRAARRELESNVRLNPDIAPRVTVSPLCISDAPGDLVIKANGGSASYFTELVGRGGSAGFSDSYSVRCVALPAFLSSHAVDPSRAFLKVDIEGAEVLVVASWFEWLAGMRVKPTMMLSMHPNDRADEAALARVLRVLHLYRFGAPWGTLVYNLGLGGSAAEGSLPIAQPATSLTLEFLRACVNEFCDILLSDYALPGRE